MFMPKKAALQLTEVYREEVRRLLSARQQSKLIHSSGDIDASGDELEVAFRDLLRRKLPNQYFVGHGHVVDQSLAVSPQFDVIIADNSSTPILFEAQNGAQYFPWEAVYAVGEIKSTYLKGKRYISRFAESIQKLKTTLQREPTPPTYLGGGVSLGAGLQLEESRAYRNPLFQFIVFFNAGDLTRTDVAREYCTHPDINLPLVSLFLDGKIIAKSSLRQVDGKAALDTLELDPYEAVERVDTHWMQIDYLSEDDAGAQALVVLMLALFNHLNRCVLMLPPINKYLHNVLKSAPNQPEAVSLSALLEVAKLSGQEIPAGAVRFLKHRVTLGKSPLGKASVKEIEQYLEATGESEQSLLGISHEGESRSDV